MKTFDGVSVSRGINIGPVYQFRHVTLEIKEFHPQNTTAELERFLEAVKQTQTKLEEIYNHAVKEIGTDEAAIFHAHIMILNDPELIDGIKEKILNDGINCESALMKVSDEYCAMLEEIDDEYIRARVLDIRDVRTSVLHILMGIDDGDGTQIEEPSIILSRDLTPSDCVSIPKKFILGFCTVEGGTTSHTAILARSLGVPAIVGVPSEIEDLPEGDVVVLDGYNAKLIHGADDATIEKFAHIRDTKKRILGKALEHALEPATTTDNARIEVFANLGSDSKDDIADALRYGAEGVGLLRTEFIYLGCNSMPDEEMQYQKYSNVAKGFGGRPVILRTLDIGGDKQLPYLELPYELNPFLGVRGLRLCLRNKPLFKAQMRSVLRAAADGYLRIMFPMVTKAIEIAQAREVIDECRKELEAEGYQIPANIEIGIMIEIPAAAIMSEHLAQVVDFFSIGTNDLTQYTMAVDRTNFTLADLANAYDPAVLTLIGKVCQSAHKYGKSVGMCGELAGDPIAIPILVGLGLDELSMNMPAIPVAKQIIRQLNKKDMEKIAEKVLTLETPVSVKEYVNAQLPFLAELS